MNKSLDPCWRKARIAAQILLKAERAVPSARDKRIAGWLAAQSGVSNRLIDQGIASIRAARRRKNGVADDPLETIS